MSRRSEPERWRGLAAAMRRRIPWRERSRPSERVGSACSCWSTAAVGEWRPARHSVAPCHPRDSLPRGLTRARAAAAVRQLSERKLGSASRRAVQCRRSWVRCSARERGQQKRTQAEHKCLLHCNTSSVLSERVSREAPLVMGPCIRAGVARPRTVAAGRRRRRNFPCRRPTADARM